MPYYDPDDDWDEAAGNGEIDTEPCPHCRRPIPEDSPRCPYCENYISEEDAPAEQKPWWIIVGVLLCLAAAVVWVFWG